MSEIFCAAPTYIQKRGQIDKPDGLVNHRMIATPWQSSSLVIYKDSALSERTSLNMNYFAKTNTLSSALEMVLQGMGVALLPELVIQKYFADGRLVRVLPKYHGWQWPFYMIHRFQGEKPVHVARFYQLVKHFFARVDNGR